MSIIHTLISADKIIVCEYTPYKGNFEQLARKVLTQTENNKMASLLFNEEFFPNQLLFHLS